MMANVAAVARLALVLGVALAEVVGVLLVRTLTAAAVTLVVDLAEMVDGVAKGVAVRVPGVIAEVGMAAKAIVT